MPDAITRLNAALEGRYRIERQLGEGGMATVYLTDDLRHERRVALKVLKPELAAVVGAERFLAEIKTTANLQHPHILPLFDSGEADSFLFYVMPYVEGESLRERLDREHQLPVDEAVTITTKVAAALQAAHDRGVIHRDIKPANVLLSKGEPLVSDFGIALAVGVAGGGRLTETGLSLGTPHYMSPEQATGDLSVGVPTDIYALACVLYEMLVGEPPFTGSTPQAVLGKIVTGEPPSARTERKSVPPNVDGAIRKALEKLPADRFGLAREFSEALGDVSFRHSLPGSELDGRPGRLAVRPGLALATAVALAALAAWGWLRTTPDTPQVPTTRFVFTPPPSALLIPAQGWPSVALSRDGRYVAYSGELPDGGGRLYVRPLDELDAAPVRGGDYGAQPFFSTDSEWIGFVPTNDNQKLMRLSVSGGSPVMLTETASMIHGGAWLEDDYIVLGTMSGGLVRVPARGGDPEPLTSPDTEAGEIEHVWPSPIQGRDAVLFTLRRQGSRAELAAFDVSSRELQLLGIEGSSGRYMTSGHIVYTTPDGVLLAAPFDVRSLSVTGGSLPVVEGIRAKPTGAADFDAAGGHLVYANVAGTLERSVLWVDRSGREEVIGVGAKGYAYPRLSPDGRRLALEDRDGEGGLWIWDFGVSTLTRLSLEDERPLYQVWTPDGQRLIYSAEAATDLFWKAANNTGGTLTFLANVAGGGTQQPEAYFLTPDAEFVVLRHQMVPATNDDLLMIPASGGDPVWRLAGDFAERNAELSPDGRWMAYQSNESGTFQVYVRPFPNIEGDQILISRGGGEFPLWARDGSELFYVEPGAPPHLISVAVEPTAGDGGFRFGDRQVLLSWPYFMGPEGRTYDVSNDGQRFVVISDQRAQSDARRPELLVVLNWASELRERVPS